MHWEKQGESFHKIIIEFKCGYQGQYNENKMGTTSEV